jgi:hypothetical protein
MGAHRSWPEIELIAITHSTHADPLRYRKDSNDTTAPHHSPDSPV